MEKNSLQLPTEEGGETELKSPGQTRKKPARTSSSSTNSTNSTNSTWGSITSSTSSDNIRMSIVEGLFGWGSLKKQQSTPTDDKRIFVEWNPEQHPPKTTRIDSTGAPLQNMAIIAGKYQIVASTLDALVDSLADEYQPDSLFINDFLLTYRNFLKPIELLQKIKERFLRQKMIVTVDPNDSSKDGTMTADQFATLSDILVQKEISEGDPLMEIIQTRIVSVLKKWVERHWYDFQSQEMQKGLKELLEIITKKEKLANISQQIKATLDNHDAKAFERLSLEVATPENTRVEGIDPEILTAKDIAKHLTMVSSELFRQIEPDEFVIFLWGDKKQKLEFAKKMNVFVERFDKVGLWIATEICSATNFKKRVSEIEKFIEVARYCFKYHNYNDTLAILFGLNTIPVRKLKKSWKAVSSRSLTTFQDLELKLGPDNNYRQYRQLETEASKKRVQIIPFFGLCMRDLTFMNDGNKSYLDNGMIDFDKHRIIGAKIGQIQIFQQYVRTIEINPLLYEYCKVIYHKSEEELIEISNELEPKEVVQQS